MKGDTFMHMTIKHLLAVIAVWAVWHFGIHDQFKGIQKNIETNYTNVAPDTRESNAESNISVFKLIGTLSGLLLAGAISGFFRFEYGRNRGLFFIFLGDIMTWLKLVVIGILLTIVVETISCCEPAKPLFFTFMILGVALYLALVLYDVYDYYC
jgi:hypothetical protein